MKKLKNNKNESITNYFENTSKNKSEGKMDLNNKTVEQRKQNHLRKLIELRNQKYKLQKQESFHLRQLFKLTDHLQIAPNYQIQQEKNIRLTTYFELKQQQQFSGYSQLYYPETVIKCQENKIQQSNKQMLSKTSIVQNKAQIEQNKTQLEKNKSQIEQNKTQIEQTKTQMGQKQINQQSNQTQIQYKLLDDYFKEYEYSFQLKIKQMCSQSNKIMIASQKISRETKKE